MVDIRLPIGVLFTIFGAILALYGAFSDPSLYAAHSLGININLLWGIALFCFGLAMLLFATLSARTSRRRP